MTETDECYAYFFVSGLFDPDEITQRVGIAPTRYFLEGDLVPRTRIRHKCSKWELHSRLSRFSNLELHISDVLAQLDANREAFKELSREFGGVLELVGYFHIANPTINFERQIVEQLAEYALEIGCDLYCLCSEEKAN